jgi:hypothetical protein
MSQEARSNERYEEVRLPDGTTAALAARSAVQEVLETGTATIVATADDWYGELGCTWGQQYLACYGDGGVRARRVPADPHV